MTRDGVPTAVPMRAERRVLLLLLRRLGVRTRDTLRPGDAPGDRTGDDALRRDGEDLRAALDAGDVTVHLQPQMSLADGRTVGVEALVRWEHPSRGVLAPRDLLPLAARAGLERALTEAVLDLALAGAARWWSHRAPLPVSVNLAAADVTDPDLPARIMAALTRHGLSSRALTVEIDEDALGRPGATAVLGALRALGIAVAVDDYGSGRSSLLALRVLPADELKLDPALVAGVATDPRAAAVARHTVALAHALGLRVVAEGAEDAATLGALAAMGCDAVQGFEIASAMPVDDFVTWLRERTADRPARGSSVPVAAAFPVASVPQQGAAYRATAGASLHR